jgi:hypothetical protein
MSPLSESEKLEAIGWNGRGGDVIDFASDKPRIEHEPWELLSAVEMRPVSFIYPPLLQRGTFHLVAGAKNAGKGTIVTWLAARFTRGEFGPKRNVMWVSVGEDSLSMDVHPRLVAAGGDPERVIYPPFHLELPEDIATIRREAERIGDVGLIVLDPVSGMLPKGTDTNSDLDVRLAIAGLNKLAEELENAVLGIRHLGKDRSRGAVLSVLGSADWANIPRVVLAVAVDREDEDVRHIQVMTGNRVSRSEAGLAFRFEGVKVLDEGEPVAKATLLGTSSKDVDDLLEKPRQTSKTRAAKMLMLDILESCAEMESDALVAQVAQATGLKAGSLRNVKTQLGNEGLIYSRQERSEDGTAARWYVSRTEAARPDSLIAEPDHKEAGGHSNTSVENTRSPDSKSSDVELSGSDLAEPDHQITTSETQGFWSQSSPPGVSELPPAAKCAECGEERDLVDGRQCWDCAAEGGVVRRIPPPEQGIPW